jgi:hypothetical protein
MREKVSRRGLKQIYQSVRLRPGRPLVVTDSPSASGSNREILAQSDYRKWQREWIVQHKFPGLNGVSPKIPPAPELPDCK